MKGGVVVVLLIAVVLGLLGCVLFDLSDQGPEFEPVNAVLHQNDDKTYLFVGDRKNNCVYQLNVTDPENITEEAIIDLSAYMTDAHLGYMDFYVTEDDLYIVSDEYYGFMRVSLNDFTSEGTDFTSNKMENDHDGYKTHEGGTGIIVDNETIYVNTGYQIITYTEEEKDVQFLDLEADIGKPDLSGAYIDLERYDDVETTTYFFTASGTWGQNETPHILVINEETPDVSRVNIDKIDTHFYGMSLVDDTLYLTSSGTDETDVLVSVDIDSLIKAAGETENYSLDDDDVTKFDPHLHTEAVHGIAADSSSGGFWISALNLGRINYYNNIEAEEFGEPDTTFSSWSK